MDSIYNILIIIAFTKFEDSFKATEEKRNIRNALRIIVVIVN